MKRMQRQLYRQAWGFAVAGAAILALLRTALTPLAADNPLPYCILLGGTGLFVAALFTLSAQWKTEPIAVAGKPACGGAASAALAGCLFTVFSVKLAYDWFNNHVMPYPAKSAIDSFDVLLVYVFILSGFVAGGFFLLTAWRWWTDKQTTRGMLAIPALAPVLWSWVRLIRYITSYVSAQGLFRNIFDLSMMLFEMLFLLFFARYISRVGEKPSCFFFSVALCAGVLCAVSCITQTALFAVQNEIAFGTCALVVSPDFGIAVLALFTAFTQSLDAACKEEGTPYSATPLIKNESNSRGDDGEGAEFLISDEWFAVHDTEDD